MSTNEQTAQPKPQAKRDFFREVLGFIGADNLSLIFALIVLVLLITVASGWLECPVAKNSLPGRT